MKPTMTPTALAARKALQALANFPMAADTPADTVLLGSGTWTLTAADVLHAREATGWPEFTAAQPVEAGSAVQAAVRLWDSLPDATGRRVFDDPHGRVAALYPAATHPAEPVGGALVAKGDLFAVLNEIAARGFVGDDALNRVAALFATESAAAPAPCTRCNGEGSIDTGIDESPTTLCNKCNGTGEQPSPARSDMLEAERVKFEDEAAGPNGEWTREAMCRGGDGEYLDDEVRSMFKRRCAAFAAHAGEVQAERIYFVRYSGQDGWREATEDAYWTFSEPNRRILFAASTTPAGEAQADATLTNEGTSRAERAPSGESIANDPEFLKLLGYAQGWSDGRAVLLGGSLQGEGARGLIAHIDARRATAGNAAPVEAAVHKDCYCGGWTDETGDYHQNGCPELASNAATAAPGDLPPLPEALGVADLAYAMETPPDWDEDYRATWQKLQVADANRRQWRTYALSLRERLANNAAPTELPPHAGMIDFMDEFGKLSHKRGWTEEQVRKILASNAATAAPGDDEIMQQYEHLVADPSAIRSGDYASVISLVRHFIASNAGAAPGNAEQTKELERLRTLLNTPELHDFAKGVVLEAAHQQERWSSSHDSGKAPADWFWLIGYLAQKAMMSQLAGDVDKALHHTVTTGAAMANWHAAILGKTTMRPGIGNPFDGDELAS